MKGRTDTAYRKHMIWRGYGMNTSRNSQLGHIIKHNNEKPMFKSKHELDLIINRKKTVCMWLFFPIRDILLIMAREGKIDGKYINRKVGWKWNDINREELMTEHKLEWKVNNKSFEEFKTDLQKIRDYRVYYTDRRKATNETITVVEQMLKNEEWTMNERDGFMKIKDLWSEYKNNCIKTKNLEFRICSERENIQCELPIVFDEDNDLHETNKCNPYKLQMLDEKWIHLENDIAVNKKKKRKRKLTETRIVEPKRLRIGNEEILEKMKEIKKILAFMKEKKEGNNEDLVLDKADQIYEINRTIYDEDVKDVFRQIVLSRKDYNDLPYKILEDELLTGKNFTIQMPKMEKIRNNLLGMLQEIDEIKTDSWKDKTLADRLQIITANRFRAVTEINMKNIFQELINFKKELELVNDMKTECESRKGIDLEKLIKMMNETNGEANYENKRLHYIERWIEEIEKGMQRGFNRKKNTDDVNKKASNLPIDQNPTENNVSKLQIMRVNFR